MENNFFIPKENINPDWNPPDGSLEFFVVTYCLEELNIPIDFLKEVIYFEDGVDIYLKNLDIATKNEEWYINLNRLSSYSLKVS